MFAVLTRILGVSLTLCSVIVISFRGNASWETHGCSVGRVPPGATFLLMSLFNHRKSNMNCTRRGLGRKVRVSRIVLGAMGWECFFVFRMPVFEIHHTIQS